LEDAMSELRTDMPAPAGFSDSLRFERLSPALGAVAHGLDLREATDSTIAAIKDGLEAHQMLFFRN
jgi:alpha-ketoglutarate-dependent taurine dioxygenase